MLYILLYSCTSTHEPSDTAKGEKAYISELSSDDLNRPLLESRRELDCIKTFLQERKKGLKTSFNMYEKINCSVGASASTPNDNLWINIENSVGSDLTPSHELLPYIAKD